MTYRISDHTLDTLEFPKIVALIKGKCLTPYGSAEATRIAPLESLDDIRTRLAENAQMKDIVNFGIPFPIYRLEDVNDLLAHSRVEGVFLEPKDMLRVNALVDVSIQIHGYDKDSRDRFPAIDPYLKGIRAFPELKAEIVRAIDETGEIKDSASPKLKAIRFELGDTRRKTISRMESIISGQKKHAGWQDDVVTQRNGRFVMPVMAGAYRPDFGIVHDRSQTGATLYVEPREMVEMNNRLNLLFQEERLEMDRILRQITKEISARADALEENTRLIGKLDMFHASAVFASQVKAVMPKLEGAASLKLIDARHPLLILKLKEIKDVVPLSIELNSDRQAILVTGPNTGGKTIVLKTIGLLVVMIQSGLLIPASELSEIGVFSRVFADIGDEQSIELSLSTFSSHVTNIIAALREADKEALVLFDEIGAGTDPKEGAALAEAVILYLVKQGARLVATTHYSQLKTLALDHSEIENASLEFDRESLAPTYRLQVGIPGSSYAVEIAGRLGMPKEVCDAAVALVGSGERSLSNLIDSLERELSTVREDKMRLTERLDEASRLEIYYREATEKLKREIDEEKQKALAETEEILTSTRRETERLVAEIRTSQASEESVKAMHRVLKASNAEVGKHKKEMERSLPKAKSVRYAKGDRVRIMNLNQVGEIDELVGRDKARINLGNFTTVVAIRQLEKVADGGPAFVPRRVPNINAQTVSPEIHLRGMTVEEAMEALDKFLDQAVVAGLKQVYVIHGKGTGTLRRMLTEFLKKHVEVDSIRLGDWNEGGAGVTIVRLKE